MSTVYFHCIPLLPHFNASPISLSQTHGLFFYNYMGPVSVAVWTWVKGMSNLLGAGPWRKLTLVPSVAMVFPELFSYGGTLQILSQPC